MNTMQLISENIWSLTLGLLLIAIGLWLRWRKQRFSIFKGSGIPGPQPNILFGNLWELSQRKSPLKCHEEWIAKYGKVVGYFFGGTPAVLVADVELVKKILIKDFNKFANRPLEFRVTPEAKETEEFSTHLTILKDKRWKEIRSIITPSFTTSKMKMMSQGMNSAVDSLLAILDKKCKEGKSFDIYQLFKGLTLDVIGRTAFGIQTDCQNNPDDKMFKAIKPIFSRDLKQFFTMVVMSFPELGELWKRLIKFRMSLQNEGRNPISYLINIVTDVVLTRRSNNSHRRQDLLQIMIDARMSESDLSKITDDQLIAGDNDTDNQEKKADVTKDSVTRLRYMSDKEIVDNALLFFIAGYETTSTALAFITHMLIHYPEVQKKIRSEIKKVVKKEGKIDYSSIQQLQYLEQVISESLRVYPPVYLFVNRVASEDVQYGPYKIKKGMKIQIPVYYMNHDPDLWSEPEKFNPDRFSPENKVHHKSMSFLTFGAGPRNCVGMRFAQLEAKLVLARILEKYEFLPTEETDLEQITLRLNVVLMYPARGINLRIKPVQPS